MSLSKPQTREEHIGWCLRKLGQPLIKVNVAFEQVNDCVEQSLEYFQRNHYDGSMQVNLPIEVTPEVKSVGYFIVDDSILGISRVLEVGGSRGTGVDAMLTNEWQMLASAARMAGSSIGAGCGGAMTGYVSYLQDRNLLSWLMGGKHTIMQWSRHTDRLYLQGNNDNLKVGTVVVVEATRVLVPDEFPQVWNDPFFKKYSTALIKQQWGNNLRKMRNIPLAGGIQLQGEEILNEANDEISALEENMLLEWQDPPMPLVG